MFPNLKSDFRRSYHKTSYKGKFRKAFIALGSQGFQAVCGYRMCHWLVSKRIPIIHFFIQRLVEIFTGISIPGDVKIGKGLLIMHFGGIVINSGTTIGKNCTIAHNVTIGNQKPGGKSPRIGNNVYICVGAKVLGDIDVGDNVIVGANAVVLKSVEANSVTAGIPAKVIRTFDPVTELKEFRYEG